MNALITAGFSSSLGKQAPPEILYIPVGRNKINATVGGKPSEVVVNVPAERGHTIAAALQSALEKRLSGTVRPRLAFDHSKTGPASGHPKAFRFEPSKGIVLSLDWSDSGRKSIEGGDYGYFSPTFYVDSNGVPADLPEKGEIGSLVDEPAFREIGLIAANDAGDDGLSSHDRMVKAFEDEYNQREQVKASSPQSHYPEFLGLTGTDLIEACLRVEAGETPALVMASLSPGLAENATIRKDTREKLESLRKALEPSAWELLQKLAMELKDSGKAKDDDEAELMAFESRPDLFEKWQDSLPKPSTLKAADSSGLSGIDLLRAAFEAEAVFKAEAAN